MLYRCKETPATTRTKCNGEGILSRFFSWAIQANFQASLKACDFSRKFLPEDFFGLELALQRYFCLDGGWLWKPSSAIVRFERSRRLIPDRA
jgi:hypothetical protein